jgi:predicted amidophosphoribosyltransferase
MKFLYKIYSRYDNFTPSRIAERLINGTHLRLGWRRYIDVVDEGNEVWVYFHGPHRFENGVYVKGIVSKIDMTRQAVFIRVREYKADRPLTDATTSQRVANAVQTRNVQVFLLPQEWIVPPECTIDSTAESCLKQQCEACPAWQQLPLIASDACGWPARLPAQYRTYAPAYWVIPSRCYLYSDVADSIRQTSELFYRFKMGEEALAYPLAMGIYSALCKRKVLDFDCVIPIPLSPDKEKKNEIHRTRLLSRELAKLLGVRVADVLSLNVPISKRRLTNNGYTLRQFEAKYMDALEVSKRVLNYKRLLLIDDVCTGGTTLRCALQRIQVIHPDCEMTAATAGQMIVKAVVRDEEALRR